MAQELRPGLVGEAVLVVAEEHTARAIGSGAALVLGTPEMVRLMEQASVAAVDPHLPAGQSTVGYYLEIRHIAPTPLGLRVTARAELTAVEGNKLTFQVEAFDEREKIGAGTHRRVVVDAAAFQSGADGKAG
ncbi:MAG: thioesterase family protein [Chloroflexi bacterium]|nr:thioesterase family protein [Chloroflexota bacterium]